ncbi:putative methionine--tRNA ligase, cytoplasmic protein rar1 [Dinochytrium kinnereticum]|nr:putative methionine--tRNA ligase, cytoplasmic protein rar1 [Dinochytrium kinnereticum]
MGEQKINKDVTILLDHHTRKILPRKGERNILITSALPYVNNIPHLGNIIGCVLSADVYARFCRLRGYNTLFVCGTDEYGTATETKALEEGLTCQEICDKYYAHHKATYDWFQCDFDHFGRTTTPLQTKITQDIYLSLNENGKIEEDSMTQLYCEKHESFLADRFVEGVCPLCSYEDARGDQCDKCGKLLNATELIKPRCKLDGASPVIRDSRHLFLNLSDLQPKLEAWVAESSNKGKWSQNSINITNSWLREGLKPRCITRDLKWGVPVPRPDFDKKVFYVWFDAPIGYLSITANYTDEWEKWWKNPEDVSLYQFMGKDNVPFHTVMFPSSLIGAAQNWTLLHHLSTTEYLQYEGEKFSKSRGVGVFGNNVNDSQIPVDVWRYFLLYNRPETSDSQFAWQPFILANNSELLANLGNYVNRVIKFTAAKYESVMPEYSLTGEAEVKLLADVNELLAQYIDTIETLKSLRTGIKLVMDISSLGNNYLQQNKIDNNLFLNQRDRCNTVVGVALNLAYLLSAIVAPYLPKTSESMLRQLNAPTRRITDKWEGNDILPGHSLGKPELLFQRIDEKRVDELRAKYSGSGSKASEAKDAGKKKRGGAKAPALLTEAPPTVQKTESIIALEVEIKEKGDLVRRLKTEKASAEAVKAVLDELLAAKERLTKEVTDILATLSLGN